MKKLSMQFTHSIYLLLAAFFWGIAFVFQSTGGAIVGPYTVNCIRSLIGSGVLVLTFKLFDKTGRTKRRPTNKAERKLLLTGGLICGLVIFFASNLQQNGITAGTSAGKAGFLTTCYILIVPIFGLFLKKRVAWNTWIGVFATLIGLYLLCVTEDLRLQFSDILVMLCAVCYAIHILVIDRYSPQVDGVRLSCIQFFVVGTLTAIPMVLFEIIPQGFGAWFSSLLVVDAWIAILYTAIFSNGAAFTLQIIGQEGVNPTIACLLMSLESVFSVLAGWVMLHEVLSSRELWGCLLIFVAVVLAQIKFPVKKKQAMTAEAVHE